jgi:tetratricopeptide (TPR) repeat protein
MIEPITARDIPITLIEQIEAGRCVLFVGPDASVPAADRTGPPGVARLAAELALRVGRQLDDYGLPWIAQLYADKLGFHALHEYVAGRLDDGRYHPTPIQHLIARLPFQWIVSTAQDRLLPQAFQDQSVPFTHVLRGDALSYGSKRTLIQIYGTATQPDTLRLTEDQQRQVFAEHSDLAEFLRIQTGKNSVLFIGYTLTDPTFRDLYRGLRPQPQAHAPRTYAIEEGDDPEESGYWQQQNLSILHADTLVFLTQLADILAQRGKAPVAPGRPYQPPPLLSAKERQDREHVLLRLSQELGISSPVESSTQLRPIANRLAFMRRVLEEQVLPQEAEATKKNLALDSPPESITAQILLQQGYAEWAEGNHEHAREFFEAAIARAPGLIDAYFSLFYLLVEEGRFDEASSVYRQIQARASEQAVLPERYQIQVVLGQSNVGIAYRAWDTEREQLVTVTILRRTLAAHKDRLEQFGQQIEQLSSAHISHLIGLDRYRGRAYLVTEYVEGQTLRSRLNAGAQLSLQDTYQIFDQVAQALA